MKLLGTPQQQGSLLERSGRLAEGKHWHASARATTTTERVGQWREALAPWEAALCETVIAERMTRFGYELTGADVPPPATSSGTCRRRERSFVGRRGSRIFGTGSSSRTPFPRGSVQCVSRWGRDRPGTSGLGD